MDDDTKNMRFVTALVVLHAMVVSGRPFKPQNEPVTLDELSDMRIAQVDSLLKMLDEPT